VSRLDNTLTKTNISKILIANRGEIAIRIAQACAELGIESIALYAEDDDQALHRHKADSAIALSGRGVKAYLDIQQIIDIAKNNNCDAVHPGYGFLSENAQFSQQCGANNLIFIGAASEILESLGNKAQARQLAADADQPLVKGLNKACTLAEITEFHKSLDPNASVMIKALSGGGGRGIRAVHRIEDLAQAYSDCQKEALLSFGDDQVYVEQLVKNALHIEVQILADQHGNVNHVWERECSIQRRNQKLIEIAPSPTLNDHQRQAIIAKRVTLQNN